MFKDKGTVAKLYSVITLSCTKRYYAVVGSVIQYKIKTGIL